MILSPANTTNMSPPFNMSALLNIICWHNRLNAQCRASILAADPRDGSTRPEANSATGEEVETRE